MTHPVEDHPRFEPEVEELLREVAADPDSWLLRVPRPKAAGVALLERPDLSTLATGLSTAEAQLLRVHRAAVADLLRTLCHKRLTEDSLSRLYVSKIRRGTNAVESPSAEECAERIRSVVRFPAKDEIMLEGYELLQRCVASDNSELPTVSQLAASSLRLEASDRARMQLGLDQLLLGAFHTAEQVLATAYTGAVHRGGRAVAATNLAFALDRGGRPGQAVDCVKEACVLDPQLSITQIYFLILTLQLGRRDELLRQASVVDELMTPDHPAIDSYARSLSQRWKYHKLNVSSDLLLEARHQAGPTARRILNVF